MGNDLTVTEQTDTHALPAAQPGGRTRAATRRTTINLLQVARYLAILLVILVLVLPFVWMVLSYFKNQIDITTSRNLLQFSPTLRNYDRDDGSQG